MDNENFYEQLDGVAMGSQVNSIIANLFKKNLNSKHFDLVLHDTSPDLEEVDRRHLHNHHKIHCQQPSFAHELTATDFPLHHGSGKQQASCVFLYAGTP